MFERFDGWTPRGRLQVDQSLQRGRTRLRRAIDRSVDALRAVSFWSAVLLPVFHISLLAVGGVTRTTLPVLLLLWAANALALVFGREHAAGSEPLASRERR